MLISHNNDTTASDGCQLLNAETQGEIVISVQHFCTEYVHQYIGAHKRRAGRGWLTDMGVKPPIMLSCKILTELFELISFYP